MTAPTVKRFTINEYHQLIQLGFLTEMDHVELIRGEIVKMTAKGTAHSTVNRRLLRELSKLLNERATLQSQDPIVLPANSEPEPDIAIVKNRPDDYLSSHPHPEDILLLIEVADSSLTYDQATKLSLYAQANILDYWIFNLIENCLECYSEPYENLLHQFGYRRKLIFLASDTVAIPSFPELFLDLSKIFPIQSENI
jgi:Uma2 family endonuclease